MLDDEPQSQGPSNTTAPKIVQNRDFVKSRCPSGRFLKGIDSVGGPTRSHHHELTGTLANVQMRPR